MFKVMDNPQPTLEITLLNLEKPFLFELLALPGNTFALKTHQAHFFLRDTLIIWASAIDRNDHNAAESRYMDT
jgi:hypothetical protein